MLYRNDKISESLKRWEKMILRLTEYADEQEGQKRLMVYQFVYSLQDDIFQIKSLISSLQKNPGQKTKIKQGLILEMYKKVSQKVEDSEIVQESNAGNVSLEPGLNNECIDTFFDETADKLKELSDNTSEEFAEEVQGLINKLDCSLESYEEWSSENLSDKSSGFKENFRKAMNRIQYYKCKTEAWINRISGKSAESVDEIKKDLMKTFNSFHKSWKELNELKFAHNS